MINVTKTFLPGFNNYIAILKRAWDKSWITNNGELVLELENKLKNYLDVNHFLFTSNGTVVLQMALKALEINKEVITTPFSYVATTGAILWEQCEPVFADINENDFCIDVSKIEDLITDRTQAILATHVYGFPCDVLAIEKIAQKHGLKVIYDGAHAFGCEYDGRSLLNYGDISTCSFHATKIFHTVEGGCIIVKDDVLNQKLYLYRQFGHINDDYVSMGINAKNSEFHAAMGLAVFPHFEGILDHRKKCVTEYDRLLTGKLLIPRPAIDNFKWNYSYYPVIFESEEKLLEVKNKLFKNGIQARRYFYPSLNKLNYLPKSNPCVISEKISPKVLCLPLFSDLTINEINKISEIIIENL